MQPVHRGRSHQARSRGFPVELLLPLTHLQVLVERLLAVPASRRRRGPGPLLHRQPERTVPVEVDTIHDPRPVEEVEPGDPADLETMPFET